jgi:hypothetical protein
LLGCRGVLVRHFMSCPCLQVFISHLVLVSIIAAKWEWLIVFYMTSLSCVLHLTSTNGGHITYLWRCVIKWSNVMDNKKIQNWLYLGSILDHCLLIFLLWRFFYSFLELVIERQKQGTCCPLTQTRAFISRFILLSPNATRLEFISHRAVHLLFPPLASPNPNTGYKSSDKNKKKAGNRRHPSSSDPSSRGT